MKKVFIKYNPYNLETEFIVEGKKLAQNSQIGERILPGARLQEWVEDLPRLLIDEYNDTDFDIVFHGTLLDFEDLTEVFTQAFERGELTATLDRIPAKETSDKEALIEDVFKEIQAGPFDELKDDEILSAFQHAKSSDFEVCVVATMSAGKSTLINSMLGAKLMPSKQEACTAIITKIKDTEDSESWKAVVYDKGSSEKLSPIKTYDNLTYDIMEQLNGDENVSIIKVTGNIPFVTAEDVSLVLIDTPGPNNSRDPEHKRVQSEFLNKTSKSLVLYIMEGTFGSDDDNALLRRVAESMKVGGKQSKDRFIFVVNKMDSRRKEDGDTMQTLDRIRTYLRKHGIVNPNLFPAAALPALDIRLIQSGADVDEDTIDETNVKVKRLNRNENMHFETYASLPASLRSGIATQLAAAHENGDANTEALIHTGITSIEAAIRQYVQKYAKTAKIKNIVDTFNHKLEEKKCEEDTKKELLDRIDDGEVIARQIEAIRIKVDDVEAAKKFSAAVDDAVVQVSDEAEDIIDSIVKNYQKMINQTIDGMRGKKISVGSADEVVHKLEQFAKDLEPNFQTELSELISTTLVTTSNALLDEYKKKLAALTTDINANTLANISIDPLKLMGGSFVPADDFTVGKFIKDEEVYHENTGKKWYKPWTWFQEKGYYERVEFIYADELAQNFFAKINEMILDNGDSAKKYALRQANRIADAFNREFERLDGVLKKKLAELESYATDKAQAEARILETEKRLEWLGSIKNRVASILEI